MNKFDKMKKNLEMLFSTILVVVILMFVMLAAISNIYKFSEKESFEKLHLETQQIKRDINLQMFSDRENLITMANFAAKLYQNGENFDLLFESFEAIGLFRNIGFLFPDNTYFTKAGEIDVKGSLVFDEEVKKGVHITGRVADLSNPGKEVVRSAVPVKTKDGQIVAMMYGVIELGALKDRYMPAAKTIDADLYVVEGGNGNFIIDTKHENLGNITELASAEYKKGYSYETLINDISDGSNGFSSFKSMSYQNNYLYTHYAPLDFADWRIMLIKPNNIVFESANSTARFMWFIALLIIFIMIVYIIFVFNTERKKSNINKNASSIRKCLLEVNQRTSKLHDALKNLTTFANARSAFFVDTYSEDYNYIIPEMRDKLLSDDDRSYFVSTLFNYAAKLRSDYGVDVHFIKISDNKELYSEMPDFCKFLKKHDIKNIYITLLTNSNSNHSILGVINPSKKQTDLLLKDIAVCFSMAVYNKKHIKKTETMALTDALTGVANRMAYKQDVKKFEKHFPDKFICIYIDVNELNLYNNQYGHSAGDQMLLSVAEALSNEFSDSMLYRMGGDEFLIFTIEIPIDEVEQRMFRAREQIEEMKYHISVGIKEKDDEKTIEELVCVAEKLMYGDKSKYYQSKNFAENNASVISLDTIKTGSEVVDEYLSVMCSRQHGVYSVSLNNDSAVQIVAPSDYFNIPSVENKFSDVFKEYIHDFVKPEYHRILLAFLQYNTLKEQLLNGYKPKTRYIKLDGEVIVLTVHLISNSDSDNVKTMWIFESDEHQ